MTYQDQLMNEKLKRFELATLTHFTKPSVLASQELSKARHDLIAFIKEAKKNAS